MKNNIKVILMILLFCGCGLYLLSKVTYTSFESNTDSTVDSDIATWNININNQNVTSNYNQTLELNDIIWQGSHTNSTTVAPGSTGIARLLINPSGTDVAIRYDLSYEDHESNNNILTVTGVTVSDNAFIKTGPNTYTGVFTLSEIKSNTTKTLEIGLVWINDEANNQADSLIGTGNSQDALITINLVATQYMGEEIIAYEENN